MFKPYYKQLINVDRIELKPSDVCKSRCESQSIVTASSITFSAVASRFPQLLKCDTDMLASYCVVPYLQCCYASLFMSSAVHDYSLMLHKRCNTDMLGVLLIYQHSPSGAVRPRDCAYISVKPLTAVLQPINVHMYILCTFIHIYVYTHILNFMVLCTTVHTWRC